MTTFDCTDIKATLSGLVDGEVDADTRHLAERHLTGCAECRALLSAAESLDEMIVADAQTLSATALPEGFIDGVLSRTVYARAYEQAGWSWTSWLGWVAAAACLMLSVSIFFLDRARRNEFKAHAPSPVERSRPVLAGNNSSERSWIWDGDVRPEALLISNVRTVDADFTLDDATRQAIDEQLESMAPTRSALQEVSRRTALSLEDALTLDSTATLLHMLIDADLRSFADIERVRQIAVYDQLPQRLADLRPRLRAADRAVVMAAESVFLRIVNGPLDLDDLRLLHDTAASMGLAMQIGAIGSAANDPSTSL